MATRSRTKSRVPGPGSQVRKRRNLDQGPGTRDQGPPPESELIAVGVIRKAHGVRGEASVEPLTDLPNRFSELKEVFLVSPDRRSVRPAMIDGSRTHVGRVLLQFREIGSPEEVREVANWTIEIPEKQAHSLSAGQYFLHDLVGLEVLRPDGRAIGVTTDARLNTGGVLLTVRKSDGTLFDLPFAEDICKEIDTKRKRLVADIPVGLEDLEGVAAVEDERAATTASLRIDIITIFPRMFDALLEEGILGRAGKSRLLRLKVWDLRDFTRDKHRSTDDEAYGGGGGMVMLGEPIFRCVDTIKAEEEGKPWVILMSPQGRNFDHVLAEDLAKRHWLVVICGRYEGIDERVREAIVDQEISVGDFVVSGGEVPAMLVIDAVARLVEGVVGDWNSVRSDSFYNGLLDHPHYTRPAELRGMRVPEVLLSGHAEKIRKWRREQAIRATLTKRPDLLEKADLDPEAIELLDKIRRGK